MNLPKLSSRLEALAQLVGQAETMVDIGTDHAFLPIYLCLSGAVQKAVAVDIHEGPLRYARAHIVEYGLENLIDLRHGSGLCDYSPQNHCPVVIAGMGGKETIKLLHENPELKRCRLILQPNSSRAELRKYLAENGFQIRMEQPFVEGHKLYLFQVVEYTGQTYPLSLAEAEIGPCILNQMEEHCAGGPDNRELRRYLMRLREQFEKKSRSDPRYKDLQLIVDQYFITAREHFSFA